jgi:hypothetical protein
MVRRPNWKRSHRLPLSLARSQRASGGTGHATAVALARAIRAVRRRRRVGRRAVEIEETRAGAPYPAQSSTSGRSATRGSQRCFSASARLRRPRRSRRAPSRDASRGAALVASGSRVRLARAAPSSISGRATTRGCGLRARGFAAAAAGVARSRNSSRSSPPGSHGCVGPAMSAAGVRRPNGRAPTL